MSWQPMSTAPKNGDDVLAFWPQVKLDDDDEMTDEIVGGVIVVTSWSAGSWSEPEVLNACGESFGDDYCYAQEPTHWHQLPPPPNAALSGPHEGTSE